MKIDKDWRPILERQAKPKPAEKSTASFQNFIQSHKVGLEAAVLEGLLQELDEQGRRLAHFRTVKDLRDYKKLIQDFVQKAVSFGLSLSKKRSWHFSQGQIQILVKEIDDHIMDLTDSVLKNGTDAIEILDKIGEIKGLLINLYR